MKINKQIVQTLYFDFCNAEDAWVANLHAAGIDRWDEEAKNVNGRKAFRVAGDLWREAVSLKQKQELEAFLAACH